MTAPALRLMRGQIDLVDRGMRRLLRLRQRLVAAIGRRKRRLGHPLQDAEREADMVHRAREDGTSLGLSESASDALLALSLRYCRPALEASPDAASPTTHPVGAAWLRWLPPPKRVAPLMRLLPSTALQQTSLRLFSAALAQPLSAGELEPLRGRRLAIEVSDMGLRWVVQVGNGDLAVLDPAMPAEASIRGTAVALLQLASRSEDADTLFFQRRLQLTGDVELGLTARNLLDRLPWEQLPLALRILLQRATRLAEAARAAHRAGRGTDAGRAALPSLAQGDAARS